MKSGTINAIMSGHANNNFGYSKIHLFALSASSSQFMIAGNNNLCFIIGLIAANATPIIKAFVVITSLKLPVLPTKGAVTKLAAIHTR